MIIRMKPGTTDAQLRPLVSWLHSQGVKTTLSSDLGLLGLAGDTSHIDSELLRCLDFIEDVQVQPLPFRRCSLDFHPNPTVVSVQDVSVGHGHFCIIAGPCSVETEEQIIGVAKAVKAAGANILRGGAFKPRTSPYDFQGLGSQGLELLLKAKQATGLPLISEIMNISQLPLFEDVDIIQIGARNMQNFDLLREVGNLRKPVLLKRGLCATIKEWLMSAEYILSQGNDQVILCERGIRTYEPYTRNTLDLSAVPVLKQLTHLPVLVDPSHATGKANLVGPMALAAAAAGADGLMIEVHNDPAHALCDGPQSITPEAFAALVQKVRAVREAIV